MGTAIGHYGGDGYEISSRGGAYPQDVLEVRYLIALGKKQSRLLLTTVGRHWGVFDALTRSAREMRRAINKAAPEAPCLSNVSIEEGYVGSAPYTIQTTSAPFAAFKDMAIKAADATKGLSPKAPAPIGSKVARYTHTPII